MLLHCIDASLFSRAVLGKSLFDVAPRDIANLKLMATVMGGELIHRDGISRLAIRRPDLGPLESKRADGSFTVRSTCRVERCQRVVQVSRHLADSAAGWEEPSSAVGGGYPCS